MARIRTKREATARGWRRCSSATRHARCRMGLAAPRRRRLATADAPQVVEPAARQQLARDNAARVEERLAFLLALAPVAPSAEQRLDLPHDESGRTRAARAPAARPRKTTGRLSKERGQSGAGLETSSRARFVVALLLARGATDATRLLSPRENWTPESKGPLHLEELDAILLRRVDERVPLRARRHRRRHRARARRPRAATASDARRRL